MDEVFTPSLRAVFPDEWLAKESVTFLAPDGQANVIASSEPIDESIDTYSYAEMQSQLLRKEFPDFQEMDFGPELILGGRPGYFRVFSWKPPDGVGVTQMQLYYAQSGRGYTATATTPTSEFPRYEEQLRTCLRNLYLEIER